MTDVEVIYYEQFTNGYICLSAFVVLYFDYFLTLPMEIERFWSQPSLRGRKIRWAQFGFYLNRYAGIFGHFPVIAEYFWVSERADKAYVRTLSCDKLQSYHQYFAICVQLISGVLLMMRMYAMFERNKYVLGVLLTEALATCAIGAWVIVSSKPDETGGPKYVPYVGCRQDLGQSAGVSFAAAWAGLLVFDAMIFALTLYKALTSVFWRAPGSRRDMLTGRTRGSGLLTILLRDGTVYFGSMVLVNLLNILSFVYWKGNLKGTGTTWTNVVASTMTSRLMLNLRDPALQPRSAPPAGLFTTIGPTGGFTTFTTGIGASTGYDIVAGDSSGESSYGIDQGIELATRSTAHRMPMYTIPETT